LTATISASKSGGTVKYNFRAFKTAGTPAFDAVIVGGDIGTTISTLTLTLSVQLATNDTFRIETEATSGTTSITVSEFSLVAS
jgi:hypothetical protein